MSPCSNFQRRNNDLKRRDALDNRGTPYARIGRNVLTKAPKSHAASSRGAALRISKPKDVVHLMGSSEYSPLGAGVEPETVVYPDFAEQIGTMIPGRGGPVRSSRYPPGAAARALRRKDDEIKRLGALVGNHNKVTSGWKKAFDRQAAELAKSRDMNVGKPLPALPQPHGGLSAQRPLPALSELSATSSTSSTRLVSVAPPSLAQYAELDVSHRRNKISKSNRIHRRPVPQRRHPPAGSGPGSSSQQGHVSYDQAPTFPAELLANPWISGATSSMSELPTPTISGTTFGRAELPTPVSMSNSSFGSIELHTPTSTSSTLSGFAELHTPVADPRRAFGFSELPAQHRSISSISTNPSFTQGFELGMQRPIWEYMPELGLIDPRVEAMDVDMGGM